MELYKVVDGNDISVHAGGTRLSVKNQRGKLYVNFKGRQINLKDTPEIDQRTYPVYFGYIFEGGFEKGPNFYYVQIMA